MPEVIGAAARLERIFYILPRAAREGGATLSELSESLGVSANVVIKDLTQVTARGRLPGAGPAGEAGGAWGKPNRRRSRPS
ncbi:MAG: hypothetical protein MUO50_03860, partial [Longimicrobiales bacterium]|nr:hypothetical protein [Longimicrobiales bacterium]